MANLNDIDDGALIPDREFAALLGNAVRGRPFHPNTLIKWRSEKRGPPWVKIGRGVAYPAKTAKRWIEKMTRQTEEAA